MKILMLTDDFPPQTFGGAGFSTFYLAQGLKKAGHEVFVITTCQDKSCQGESDYQGLKVFRIFTKYHERWRAYFGLYNPWVVRTVKKLMAEINPDVVHAHNIHSYLSYACLKAAKKLKKPVFLTARDTMSFNFGKLATKRYLEKFDARTSWFDHLKQARKRYHPFRNIIIRHYLKYVDKVFAVSYALKRALEQNRIKNVEASHTGIETADWQVTPEKIEEFRKKYQLNGRKIVFFGGRISVLKGLEQINEAMDKVKKEVPEAVLLAAGKGGIGWLDNDELRAAYYSSDVVVVPSIYLDPFPRSNLEAMACQKPVVATCFGGSPEIVQDGVTGFVVDPLDTKLMAEKIIDLLKNPEKAEQFGQAGCERLKTHFNQDSHVAQTVSWYQKLIDENNMKRIRGTREIITYARKYISGKTLDLGAGSGKYREIIKSKAQNYVTFDMVPGENIDVVGDVLDTPFEAESFNTIISTQVLEHVKKPWLMIKEISRILKENGICILTAPFLEPYHADPHDYFRYTVEGIKSLFENEDFEVLECASYGRPFSVLAGFIRISWFSHYQKRKKGSWKITHFMDRAADFLNRFTKNKTIYSDVYIVAKRKQKI